MNMLTILLQSQPGQNNGNMMIWMIIFFVLIWLLMMRPQQKKAKEERKFRESLKPGDRVVFSGGIYGKVSEVSNTTVDVEVSNGVILTVEKSMIQPVSDNNNAR